MKKQKYLPLYYKWMKKGQIPFIENLHASGGLCSLFPDDPLLELLTPKQEELQTCMVWGYWGADGLNALTMRDRAQSFTPLRQTIVLLMAAMNDEL